MGANTSNSGLPMPIAADGGRTQTDSVSGNISIFPLASANADLSGTSRSSAGLAVNVPYTGSHYHRDQRRKRVTGFATLKRKFIRRRRSSKACDHARVLRDFVSDWAPLELAALCEEFEALAALRDLSVRKQILLFKLLRLDLICRYKRNWPVLLQQHTSKIWPLFMI